MLAERHHRQRRAFLDGLFRRAMLKQGQRHIVRQAAHCPQRLAPVQPDTAEGIGFGQRHQGAFGQMAAARAIGEVGKVPRRIQRLSPVLAEAGDLTKAQPQRRARKASR